MSDELVHMRCIGCGKVLASKWDKYQKLLSDGVSPEKAMTEVGLTRYCCKIWMQSPFKIPHRATQEEAVEIKPTETLTMAVPPQQPVGVLQGMTAPPALANKFQYTVVPQQTPTMPGLPTLPAIPDVALPNMPGIPTGPVEMGGVKKDVSKCYISW